MQKFSDYKFLYCYYVNLLRLLIRFQFNCDFLSHIKLLKFEYVI